MRRKNKRAKLVALIFSLLLIGIGYAYLSANLKITGTAKIRDAKWDVHFENAKKEYATDTVTFDSNSNSNLTQGIPVIKGEDNTELEWNVTLNQPGDEYAFSADIVNAGDIDADIDFNKSKIKVELDDEELFDISLNDYFNTSYLELGLPNFLFFGFSVDSSKAVYEDSPYYIPAHQSIPFYSGIEISDGVTNDKWNSIKGKELKITYDMVFVQSDDPTSNKIEYPSPTLQIRVDNPVVNSVGSTVTYPENSTSIPKFTNGEIVDGISDHTIEYEVIFNQPTDFYDFNIDIINDSFYVDAERELMERFITIGDGEEQKFSYLSSLYEFFDYTYLASPSWRLDYISKNTTKSVHVHLGLDEDITEEDFNVIKGKVIKIKYHFKYRVGDGMDLL